MIYELRIPGLTLKRDAKEWTTESEKYRQEKYESLSTVVRDRQYRNCIGAIPMMLMMMIIIILLAIISNNNNNDDNCNNKNNHHVNTYVV